MHLARSERVCSIAIRNLLSFTSRDIEPRKILIQRLDAHRKRCPSQPRVRFFTTTVRRRHESQLVVSSTVEPVLPPTAQPIPQKDSPAIWTQRQYLPISCPGCGALTQESETDSPGFYSRSRRAVRRYLKQKKSQSSIEPEDSIDNVEEDEAESSNAAVSEAQAPEAAQQVEKVPYCDRCHDLIYNSRGRSIVHPSLQDIADSIAESPFRRNHVYHVVDAADFPMSLVPDIFSKISLAKPRSQNRRSQHDFSTKPTLSFIITRSDLLGSTKEMVDSMMTYFQSVLRQALGRSGKDLRLGNIHLVSAKRGWWTKEIKEDIWKRGGGNWMVGKVNVGKSNLFEVLFPKGSGDRAPVYAEVREKQEIEDKERALDQQFLSENSLLPPAQAEDPFPVLPVVSSLPGTTASPIRLPFGGHRGELIDLPGLERGNLEDYVKQEHKLDLIMTHRHNVEQHVIKPGQSLVLGGGLVRITPELNPEDRNTVVLAYPFLPLKAHVTSTEKAAAQQLQQRQSGIESVLAEDAGAHMASAGVLDLSSDVTKMRSGPLLRSGVSLSKLPYRVYATDVLVEGMGWVELVCQTRRFPAAQPASTIVAPVDEVSITAPPNADSLPISEPEFAPFSKVPPPERRENEQFPRVEVFSPNGKHISSRPSLSAWVRWTEGRKKGSGSVSKRPRKPSRGAKSR